VEVSEHTKAQFAKEVFDKLQKKLDQKQARLAAQRCSSCCCAFTTPCIAACTFTAHPRGLALSRASLYCLSWCQLHAQG
jgi:hypothetical protein